MKKDFKLIISDENVGKRLDVAITKQIPNISRSSIKVHLKKLLVNNKTEKLSYKCNSGDEILLELEWIDNEKIIPENIPLNILFEDDNYIVINKMHNMVVHPAKGNYTGTLVNALLGLKKNLFKGEDETRLGIVHRLDKETSGIIIVAKNSISHTFLSKIFKERNITKKYHAIVKGYLVPCNFIIENNIGRHPKNRKKMAVLKEGGKKSITIIEKVVHYKGISYLDIKLVTGRTHQIRVHLSNFGHPIVGDTIYSRKNHNFEHIPLCLSAYKLSFFDDLSKKQLDFQIEDPIHMKKLLSNYK